MTVRVKGEVFIFLVINKNNPVSDTCLLEAAGKILTCDTTMLGISVFSTFYLEQLVIY